MKKIVVSVLSLLFVGATFAVAAPTTGANKISSQILQGPTTVTISGTKVSVPQGQTIILGKRADGSLVIRGANLENIKINDATVSTTGYTVLSYRPSSNVAFLNQGQKLEIVDGNGQAATVEQGGAISATDAAVNSNTVAALKEAAKAEAQAAVKEGIISEGESLPAFVAATEESSAATEQATQDVEETLSHSAPGRN